MEGPNRVAVCEADGVRPEELSYRYGPHHRASERHGEKAMDAIDRVTDALHNISVEGRDIAIRPRTTGVGG